MAFPIGGRGRDEDPILCTEYQSIKIEIYKPGGAENNARNFLKGSCALIHRSTEDLLASIETLLQGIGDRKDCDLRMSSIRDTQKEFPFESAECRSFCSAIP